MRRRFEIAVGNFNNAGITTHFGSAVEVGGLSGSTMGTLTSAQSAIWPAGYVARVLPPQGRIVMIGVQLTSAVNLDVEIVDSSNAGTGDNTSVATTATSLSSVWEPTFLQVELAQVTTVNPGAAGTVRNLLTDLAGSGSESLRTGGTATDRLVVQIHDDGSAKVVAEVSQSDAATSQETAGTAIRVNHNVENLALTGKYTVQSTGDEVVAWFDRDGGGNLWPGVGMKKRQRLVGSWRCSVPALDAASAGLHRSVRASDTAVEYFNVALQDSVPYAIDNDASLSISLATDITAYSQAMVSLWIETD